MNHQAAAILRALRTAAPAKWAALVHYTYWSAIVTVIAALCAVVICAVASVLCFRHFMKDKRSNDVFLIIGWILVFAAVMSIVVTCSQIPAVIQPEGAVLNTLMSQCK